HAGLLRNLGARHRRLSVLTEPNVAHVAKPVYRRRPALLAKHQERGLLLYPGEDERPERLAVAVEPCAVEKHLDVRRGSPLALLGVLDDSRLLDRGGGYWLGLVLRLLHLDVLARAQFEQRRNVAGLHDEFFLPGQLDAHEAPDQRLLDRLRI